MLYKRLAERAIKREREFMKFVQTLTLNHGKDVTIVLFGSRARGDYNMMSDFDLLVIYKNKTVRELDEYKPIGVQVFYLDLEELDDRLQEFNTILIDAVVEGRILHDGLNIWEEVKMKVLKEIKKRNLKKTSIGWIPAHKILSNLKDV